MGPSAALRSAIAASLIVVGACDDSGTVVPPPAASLDLGDGVVATFGPDGAFSIARGGATLVATPAGAPLFSRVSDPDNPDAWHDPREPNALPSVAVDPRAVAMTDETGGDAVKVVHLAVAEQDATTALVSLALASDGGFYGGLGERFSHADARGAVWPMFFTLDPTLESGTDEAHVPVPFFVSSSGYGVFVASREAGAFDVASTDPSKVTATFEGRALDVYVYAASDPLAIVARFARQTGLPRPLPRYALAPMEWHDQWNSDDDALSTANELRARKIPAGTLWIDNPWQTSYNTFRFDSAFANPEELIGELTSLGFHTVVWTTPYLEAPTGSTPADEAQELFETAQADHYFVEAPDGTTFLSPAPIKEGAGVLDFTSAAASAYWEDLFARATSLGVSGVKVDYGEDFVANLVRARLDVVFSDGSTGRTARLYPLAMHHAYHAQLDRDAPGEGITIVRASAYGGAADVDVVWPGDLDNGFEHLGDTLADGTTAVGGLPSAVVACQTLAASGFPIFGSDTGGYRHGAPAREALLRWAEHTALSMILQLGGGGESHDPWDYDEDASTIYAGLARLRMQLAPYLENLARASESDGTPTIRSLPLAYPQDSAGVAHADDEYLLGPDLLVAPVTTAGVTSRDVHLPPGAWIGWFDDALHAGGADITQSAPLGQPALFARAGAIVPMLPDGIDTLGDATAPGVVTAASMSSLFEARAWVSGDASVSVDDGAAIAVSDASGGTIVTFTPGAARTELTIDVDVRARTGAGATPGALTVVSGDALDEVADEDAVRAATGGAYAIDAASGHVTVRWFGAGAVRIE